MLLLKSLQTETKKEKQHTRQIIDKIIFFDGIHFYNKINKQLRNQIAVDLIR